MSGPRLQRVPVTLVTAVVVLGLLAEGCGFGERRAQAERLLKTPSRIKTVQTAKAKMTVKVVPRLTGAAVDSQVPEELREQLGGGQRVENTALALIDFTTGRSQLSALEAPDAQLAIYDDALLYLRRGGRRRPWVVLDFERVDARTSDESNPPPGFIALAPHSVVELLAGALSGSVKREGTEKVGDVQTTRFSMNVDWEKAVETSDQAREFAGLEKFTEDERESLQRVYESMAIADPIFRAQVWLDDDGLLRKLEFVLEQRIMIPGQQQQRRNRMEMTLTLELFDFDAPLTIALPDKAEVVRVESFQQLVREARNRTAPTRVVGGDRTGEAGEQPPLEELTPGDLPPDVRARLGR